MLKLYYRILSDFNGSKELISVNYVDTYQNYLDISESSNMMIEVLHDNVINNRINNEYHFHTFLENQLFAKLQEIKSYSTVDICSTRRLISTSSDCISAIQILIRDNIYINVYFRSSDFDGALPADLAFISSLPYKLIHHLLKFQGTNGYDEVTDECINSIKKKSVVLSLMFGSLHRTKYV